MHILATSCTVRYSYTYPCIDILLQYTRDCCECCTERHITSCPRALGPQAGATDDASLRIPVYLYCLACDIQQLFTAGRVSSSQPIVYPVHTLRRTEFGPTIGIGVLAVYWYWSSSSAAVSTRYRHRNSEMVDVVWPCIHNGFYRIARLPLWGVTLKGKGGKGHASCY